MIFEKWITLHGYDGNYDISSLGRIRSWATRGNRSRSYLREKEPRLLRPFTCGKNPYFRVKLRCKRLGKEDCPLVHRIVLEAFFGPCPPNKEGAHLDGNPKNNMLNNLMWATKKENMSHQYIHGTRIMAENHPKSKLSNDQVIELRRLRRNGYSLNQLSEKYGIHFSTAGKIAKGKLYSSVPFEKDSYD